MKVKDLLKVLEAANPEMPVEVVEWKYDVTTDTDIMLSYNLISAALSYPVKEGAFVPADDALPDKIRLCVKIGNKKPVFLR